MRILILKGEFCPRGDSHPLIATEESPVGGSGLGRQWITVIIIHCNDYYVNLQS